eukprot:jgi/Botrbrau1/271/Bobra.0022s0240.1
MPGWIRPIALGPGDSAPQTNPYNHEERQGGGNEAAPFRQEQEEAQPSRPQGREQRPSVNKGWDHCLPIKKEREACLPDNKGREHRTSVNKGWDHCLPIKKEREACLPDHKGREQRPSVNKGWDHCLPIKKEREACLPDNKGKEHWLPVKRSGPSLPDHKGREHSRSVNKGREQRCPVNMGGEHSLPGRTGRGRMEQAGGGQAVAQDRAFEIPLTAARFGGLGHAAHHWGLPLANHGQDSKCGAVYADMHQRGYHMTCGANFGADLLAYPGDPSLYPCPVLRESGGGGSSPAGLPTCWGGSRIPRGPQALVAGICLGK